MGQTRGATAGAAAWVPTPTRGAPRAPTARPPRQPCPAGGATKARARGAQHHTRKRTTGTPWCGGTPGTRLGSGGGADADGVRAASRPRPKGRARAGPLLGREPSRHACRQSETHGCNRKNPQCSIFGAPPPASTPQRRWWGWQRIWNGGGSCRADDSTLTKRRRGRRPHRRPTTGKKAAASAVRADGGRPRVLCPRGDAGVATARSTEARAPCGWPPPRRQGVGRAKQGGAGGGSAADASSRRVTVGRGTARRGPPRRPPPPWRPLYRLAETKGRWITGGRRRRTGAWRRQQTPPPHLRCAHRRRSGSSRTAPSRRGGAGGRWAWDRVGGRQDGRAAAAAAWCPLWWRARSIGSRVGPLVARAVASCPFCLACGRLVPLLPGGWRGFFFPSYQAAPRHVSSRRLPPAPRRRPPHPPHRDAAPPAASVAARQRRRPRRRRGCPRPRWALAARESADGGSPASDAPTAPAAAVPARSRGVAALGGAPRPARGADARRWRGRGRVTSGHSPARGWCSRRRHCCACWTTSLQCVQTEPDASNSWTWQL